MVCFLIFNPLYREPSFYFGLERQMVGDEGRYNQLSALALSGVGEDPYGLEC